MKILDIYKQYEIPPDLIEHQLNVASVGQFIWDTLLPPFQKTVSVDDLTKALLIHDMGNFAKYNLEKFPIKGWSAEYAKEAQKRFIAKWGDNATEATYKIAEDLGVSSDIVEIMRSIGFENASNIYKETNHAQMISNYADQRVTPEGVMPLLERLEEGRARYVLTPRFRNKDKNEKRKDRRAYNKGRDALLGIESLLFTFSNIGPEYVIDETIAVYKSKLMIYDFNAK